jgi:hypothetical protein
MKLSFIKLSFVVILANLSTIILLIIAFWFAHQYNIPFSNLSRDVANAVGAPFYTGFLSNIGAVFWLSTSCVCIFAGIILWNLQKDAENIKYCLVSGCFTLLLGLDDLFLVHNIILPRVKIPEIITYTIYVALLIYYLLQTIKLTPSFLSYLLYVALLCFAISVVLDLDLAFLRFPFLQIANNQFLLEDGFKLIGIINWSIFNITLAHHLTLQSLTEIKKV